MDASLIRPYYSLTLSLVLVWCHYYVCRRGALAPALIVVEVVVFFSLRLSYFLLLPQSQQGMNCFISCSCQCSRIKTYVALCLRTIEKNSILKSLIFFHFDAYESPPKKKHTHTSLLIASAY
jgi:hypothetical protein